MTSWKTGQTKMMLLPMTEENGKVSTSIWTGIIFPPKGRDTCYDSMRTRVLPPAPPPRTKT